MCGAIEIPWKNSVWFSGRADKKFFVLNDDAAMLHNMVNAPVPVQTEQKNIFVPCGFGSRNGTFDIQSSAAVSDDFRCLARAGTRPG